MIHWLAMVPWIALVLLLLWRVVRMEGLQRDVYDNMRQMLKLNDIGRASEVDVLRAENRLHEVVNKDRARVHALARALGYEWKRTDAKEGWEKREEFCLEYVPMSVQAVRQRYHREYDWTLPTTNRRNADRRKPTPQAPPKSPPKKPRRAL